MKPVLKHLYRLPVEHRIIYKLCLLMYLIHIGKAPQYSTDCVCFYTVSAVRVRYRMRSTDTSQSVHGFCYSGPTAWNSILSDAHDITDTNTFKNGS